MKNIPIGEVLKEYGYITEAQVQDALVYQKEHKGKRLGEVLMELGFVSETQVLQALAQKLNQKILVVDQVDVDIEAVLMIPEQIALKYNILAYSKEGNTLEVLVNDPLNFYALEDVRQLTGMFIHVGLCELSPLKRALEYYYSEVGARKAAQNANLVVDDIDDTASVLAEIEDDSDSDAPIIKLVSSLVARAYSNGASDIHVEPFEKETIVRMRIDGTIVEYVTLKSSIHAPLIARIKIMGEMDIAERRVPQDGHFKMKMDDGTTLNMRVSVIPTVFGEKAVMRLLNNQGTIDHAGNFGMADDDYNRFMPLLKAPNGILYITGPTGSGKTTTLYMILDYLTKGAVNISTIEDPVEKNIPKVNQMQVNNTAGLTFEVGLRALLRQDPDIIMVGETRDAETASISVRSAITGHFVLSTLHTNSAVSSIVRLLDMGIEPYMVANSLVGIMAQRLMRKVCPDCGEIVPTTDQDRLMLGEETKTKMVAHGCPKCNNTGYRGRTAIHEIAVIDKQVKAMIAEGSTVEEIEEYCIKEQGMRTLRVEAIDMVKDHITTMDELLKIAYD